MEFCVLGRSLTDDRVTSLDLASTRAFIDFDASIIDPAGIRETHAHYDRRRTEFEELLALGGSIIWFVRPLAIHPVLPIDVTEGRAYSGTKTEFVGSDAFRDFWNSIEPIVEYEAYLYGAYGEPIAKVRNSDKTIASWIRRDQGLIILLPCLKRFATPRQLQDISQRFVNATEALLQQFRARKSQAKLPSWSLQYTWKSEGETRRKLAELETLGQKTMRDIAATW